MRDDQHVGREVLRCPAFGRRAAHDLCERRAELLLHEALGDLTRLPDGREDEVPLRFLRDGRVGLLDLALQDLNVDLELNGHHASLVRSFICQGMDAGRSARRGCHEVAATRRPLAPVSTATIRIAVCDEVRSAPIPAIRAPTTKPKSRQKRYTPTTRAWSRGWLASETAAIRVG